jgi:hypothetical protein
MIASPSGLRRRSAAARLLRLWVRIPPGSWTFVSYECCVLSGRSLCDELIIRPEEYYRPWRVVCDLETSWMRRSWPTGGGGRLRQKQNKTTTTTNFYDQKSPSVCSRSLSKSQVGFVTLVISSFPLTPLKHHTLGEHRVLITNTCLLSEVP